MIDIKRPRHANAIREFPLLLRFDMVHPVDAKYNKREIAAFRDWEHYKAFVKQMFERNAFVIKNMVQLDEAYNVKIIH